MLRLLLERSSRRRECACDGWSGKEIEDDACPCGGVDWLVGQLLRDLRKMGVHGKVIL